MTESVDQTTWIKEEEEELARVAALQEAHAEACREEIPFRFSTYLSWDKVLRHFVTGFISGWIGVNLLGVLIFHLVWEIAQNTEYVRSIYFRIYGRDPANCSWQETMMDNVLFTTGWILAYLAIAQGLLVGWKKP